MRPSHRQALKIASQIAILLVGGILVYSYVRSDWMVAILSVIDWHVVYIVIIFFFIGLILYFISTVKDHLKAAKVKNLQKMRITEGMVTVQIFGLIFFGIISVPVFQDLITYENPISYTGPCDVTLYYTPSELTSRQFSFASWVPNCSMYIYNPSAVTIGSRCEINNDLAGVKPGLKQEYSNLKCSQDVSVTYLKYTKFLLSVTK